MTEAARPIETPREPIRKADPEPRWARWLGLRRDWQSLSWHDSRTYHSPDRNIEVTVGRGTFWLACEVSRWEEHTSLHLAIPRLGLHWRIGPGGDVPLGEMAVSWGGYIAHGDLVLSWGGRGKRIALNPFRWHGYERARLRADGEWDATDHWTPEGKEIDWYVETHPYVIVSEPHYYVDAAKPRFGEIEVWHAEATCHIERAIRTRRWLPWWRRVEHWVDFRLSEEVGRGKGSWKGGTVGFSEEMLPGDRIADVVHRAARKGRGR